VTRGNQLPKADVSRGLSLMPATAWVCPRDRYDAAARRLLATAGRMVIAELSALGVTLRLAGREIRAGPRERITEAVTRRIEANREALAACLEEIP
jgi:hypothetical protein